MRNSILLIISLFIVSACYKDTDLSTTIENERGPRIIVDGHFVGNYQNNSSSNISSFELSINDVLYPGINGVVQLESLKNVEKNGQFIELFEDGHRVGAAQLPIIENDINYLQLIGSERFEVVEFKSYIELSEQFTINLIDAAFTDSNSNPVKENLSIHYHYSENSDYLNQLVSFAFGKNNLMEVVFPKASFYLGVENNGNELIMSNGELNIEFEDVSDQSLFHFNTNDQNWEWVSDLSQGINQEKISEVGWYVIGSSAEAAVLKGQININGVAVANQKVTLTSGDFQVNAVSTSTGKIECFVPKSDKVNLELVSKSGSVIYSEENLELHETLNISIPDEVAERFYVKSDFEVLNCDGSFADYKNLNIELENGRIEVNYLKEGAAAYIQTGEDNFKIFAGDGPKIEWANSYGDIKYLTNCASLQDGFTFMKVRSDQKIYPAFQTQKMGDRIFLSEDNNLLKLIVETNSKGSLNSDQINISINDLDFGNNGYYVFCETAPSGCGIDICEITHFKEAGDEWNRVYFKGKIWMQTIDPAQAGNFEVEGYILSKR